MKYLFLPRHSSSGVTMTELLVVILILAILIIIALMFLPKYIIQASDSKKKSDFAKMKVAFEDYITDKGCYPESSDVQNCWSDVLSPYLPKMYCDRDTNQAYRYVRSDDCLSYQMYTTLKREDDEAISKIGCGGGCGPDDDGDGVGDYNYGIAGGNVTIGNPLGDGVVPAMCGTDEKFCYSNQCGACCPGSNYRCNGLGTGCFYDSSCVE